MYEVFVAPFVTMAEYPAFFVQVIWEGVVSGSLYALIALGFVLIFKASGVFNFAQGIMVVFAALTLVGLHNNFGIPGPLAVLITIAVMYVLAVAVERFVLHPLTNQPDIILFMATIGLTFFLIGLGEFIFGGRPETMITQELFLPSGGFEVRGVRIQKLDLLATVLSFTVVGILALLIANTRLGRALRAVADDHQAALSIGISLRTVWIMVWFIAGIIALFTGIMWGAKSEVSFALEIIAYKALPVLILGGFTSIPGAVVGGFIIGVGEKIGEIYWGPLLGGGIESWLAYVMALLFLLVRPQGLFGEKIIERI